MVVNDEDRVLLGRAAGRLQDLLARAATETGSGLTPAQLRVVALLADGPATVTAVAAATSSAVSTASRTADRLSGAGLLERSAATDRREVVLRLTRAGRAVAADWVRRRGDVVVDALDPLPAESREAVLVALRATALRPVPPAAAAGGREGPGGAPSPDAVRAELVAAALACDADRAPAALVAAAARLLGGVAQLSVLAGEGDLLLPQPAEDGSTAGAAAALGAAGGGLLLTAPEPVEGGARGEALRRGAAVVERGGGRTAHHLPLLGRAEVLGVLTVVTAEPAEPAEPAGPAEPAVGDVGAAAGTDERWVDAADAAARCLELLLPAAATGSRALQVAHRAREWTVGAEVQSRQLPGSLLRGAGQVVAAHLQPAWAACSDAYDLDLRDGVLDVVLLDARTARRRAPLVTALAAGALRHARALGRGPAEQAALLDEVLFGAGAGTPAEGWVGVDLLLLRVEVSPWRVVAVATSGLVVLRQRGGEVVELDLVEHEVVGASGDAGYREQVLDALPGDRLLLLGDGVRGDRAADPWRAARQLRHLAGDRPDEVVRRVVLDRLRASGEEGPADDVTAVCLDLGEPA